MIRFISCNFDAEQELIPQAIFGRALKFFTWNIGRTHDDLDFFEGAMFCFQNDFHFALKHYDGHPDFTVTLYIEADVQELSEITAAVAKVVEAFQLPETAVLWRRGDALDVDLTACKPDRLFEKEARMLVLKIAALQPNHEASTTFIKQQVPEYRPLSDEDLAQSPTRKREKVWQQVVGNVKVHYQTTKNIFKQGLAERTTDGVRVTEAGLDFLVNMGFPVAYSQV